METACAGSELQVIRVAVVHPESAVTMGAMQPLGYFIERTCSIISRGWRSGVIGVLTPPHDDANNLLLKVSFWI